MGCGNSKEQEAIASSQQHLQSSGTTTTKNSLTRRLPQDATSTSTTPHPDNTTMEKSTSVYFDAVMTQDEIDQLAHELFSESRTSDFDSYAPAEVANRRPRSSILMEEPSTLLLLEEEDDTATSKSAAASLSSPRRPTVILKEGLTTPKNRLQLQGYPGDLTSPELEHCLEFRRQLQNTTTTTKAYYDMVHVWDGYEDEAFALCRFLRARQFDPPAVLEMMSEHVPRFQKAQSHNFYLQIDDALGCPASVFLSQYPYNFHGSAKSGCPIAFFQAGRVNVDGIDCCTDIDTKLVRYLWYGLKYAFPKQVAKLHPDKARCELVFVVDLKGLTAGMLNSRTMGLFQKLSEATGSFPEVLNKTIVLNAPGYFAFSWRIMKGFLHPRTAAKIEIYSDASQGQKRLLELIDKKELLSDYGGQSISFEELSRPKGVLRQMTELTSFVRSGMSKTVQVGSLSSEECMNVSVYSRSKSGADVSVVRSISGNRGGDTGCVAQATVTPAEVNDDGTYCVTADKQITGPGKFAVTVKTRQTAKSKEHFLVVAEVVAAVTAAAT